VDYDISPLLRAKLKILTTRLTACGTEWLILSVSNMSTLLDNSGVPVLTPGF
jgi:hypothetical protein